MLDARQNTNQKTTPYAKRADFCRIFVQDMDRLYLLAWLLTGNDSTAEKCFVRGLDDSAKGNRVFKEWAQSWARRAIIQKAIQIIRPRPTERSLTSSIPNRSVPRPMLERAEIAKIVELPAFERFAFVMSVLEGYSDQECSLLLDCNRGEVMAARTRAIRQIAKSADLGSKVASIGAHADDRPLPETPGPVLQPEAIAKLAASA
jgi:DNA-directed RNA polymerase specialized sigma24 family protein